MVIKKATTTAGATGSGGNDGSDGTKVSGASRGLDKSSNVIGTSIGTPGTAEVVIHPPLIAKIISLCGLPEDSAMVMFMLKKKWKELFDVLSTDVDDINAFHTVKKDFKLIYICMFKCFLLYYKRKYLENGRSLSEGDVLTITSAQFKSYASSGEYVIDSNAWLEAYAAKQAVTTVNADVVGHIDAQELVKTTDVHGNRLQYEANLKEHDSAHGFDVETRFKDVINDDKFVAKRIYTDVSDIMVNKTNASRFGHMSFNGISKSTFLPRDEWN
jgi:hypothetical protein